MSCHVFFGPCTDSTVRSEQRTKADTGRKRASIGCWRAGPCLEDVCILRIVLRSVFCSCSIGGRTISLVIYLLSGQVGLLSCQCLFEQVPVRAHSKGAEQSENTYTESAALRRYKELRIRAKVDSQLANTQSAFSYLIQAPAIIFIFWYMQICTMKVTRLPAAFVGMVAASNVASAQQTRIQLCESPGSELCTPFDIPQWQCTIVDSTGINFTVPIPPSLFC